MRRSLRRLSPPREERDPLADEMGRRSRPPMLTLAGRRRRRRDWRLGLTRLVALLALLGVGAACAVIVLAAVR